MGMYKVCKKCGVDCMAKMKITVYKHGFDFTSVHN
jgi:hypothetical protein